MAAPQDALTARKVQLLTKLNQLVAERETIWNGISEKQYTCSDIILEQVEVNEKFTDFHNMYMEINLSWPTELQSYPAFVDLLEDVRRLSDWMRDFEPKTNEAINAFAEISTIIRDKHTSLRDLLPTITEATNLSQLTEIDLENFQWVASDTIPNTQELEDEWKNKNMAEKMNLCVLEMTQLFNTPVGVLLSELEFLYEASSSSPDSIESLPL